MILYYLITLFFLWTQLGLQSGQNIDINLDLMVNDLMV